MVLPWLIVGAGAALEARRRTQAHGGNGEVSNEVARLKSNESRLQNENRELCNSLKDALHRYEQMNSRLELDQDTIQEYERMRSDIERKVEELEAKCTKLNTDNTQLRIDNANLEDKAALFQLQNKMLEDNATELRKENDKLQAQLEAMSKEEQEDRIIPVLEEVKEGVRRALQSFADGSTSADELEAALEGVGIQIECKEQLAALQTSQPARVAIKDEMTDQINSQMGLVLEDKARLARLVGIAQQLQLPSVLTATPSNASTASTMSSRAPSNSFGSDLKLPSGGNSSGPYGLLRAFGYGGQDMKAPAASSVDSEEVQQRLESITLEPDTGTTSLGSAKPKGGKKAAIAFRFKGLAETDKPFVTYDRQRPATEADGGDDMSFSGAKSSALTVRTYP